MTQRKGTRMLNLSEEEIREKMYTTSNLNLCGYLVTHNFNYIDAKRFNKNMFFYFEKSKELYKCIDDYFANKELKDCLDTIRTIRKGLKLID